MVADDPKLDVMSERTTPDSESTSGPLEASPGYGPTVSSGITVQSVEVPVVPTAVEALARGGVSDPAPPAVPQGLRVLAPREPSSDPPAAMPSHDNPSSDPR